MTMLQRSVLALVVLAVASGVAVWLLPQGSARWAVGTGLFLALAGYLARLDRRPRPRRGAPRG